MNLTEPLLYEFVTEDLLEHHLPSSSSKVQKFISAVFAKFNVSMKKKMKKTTSSSSRWTTTTANDDKKTLAREVYNDKSVLDETEENSTADYQKPFMTSSLENGIDFRKEGVSSDKQVLVDLIDWGSTEEAKDENCNASMSLPEGLQRQNACLQRLTIRGCHTLTFIFKSQLPSSLKRLEVSKCGKLQYLFDYNTSQSFLEHLQVSECPSLTCLSSRVEPLAVLKHLNVSDCPKLVTLSSSGQLPQTLQHLNVFNCPKLESIAKSFHSNMSLEYIMIRRCEELKLLPGNLNSLSCLRVICIWDCPSLVSFPEGGLPCTNLRLFSLDKCSELKALPEHMHKLNSLEELKLGECASIISMEKEGLPTSLTSLSIADLGFYRPLIEWGLHKLTSLKTLEIKGCVYAESFPQDYTGLVLPTSLTRLTIIGFPRLKYLSSMDLQNLEYLSIIDCPALTSLPESGLPPSLVQLYRYDCPLLKNGAKRTREKSGSRFPASLALRLMADSSKIEGVKNKVDDSKKSEE